MIRIHNMFIFRCQSVSIFIALGEHLEMYTYVLTQSSQSLLEVIFCQLKEVGNEDQQNHNTIIDHGVIFLFENEVRVVRLNIGKTRYQCICNHKTS